MARLEQDREDILREATGLVERVELSLHGTAEQIVIGFRCNGAASFYVDQDPVFHFNVGGELRRGYRDGRLLKAERGSLVALQRRRTPDEVQLVRHESDALETEEYLAFAKQHLRQIQDALNSGQYKIVGQVPDGANVVERILEWLDRRGETIHIAERPHVAAKSRAPE